MPAIVALVAGNFPQGGRPRAYGLIGAAGAIAIAVGPLIGGLATTYASWRWVFAGEVVVGAGIVLLGRRMADTPVEDRPHLDLLGSLLWALGMGLVVFGVLFSSEWGAIRPKQEGPSILGLSPVVWLILAGLIMIRLFMGHIRRLDAAGAEPLVTPSLFRNQQMNGGLLMFFFQFVVMMGIFFVIPLYLSVALGLSAIDTGLQDHAAVDHDAARGGGRAEVLPVDLAPAGRGARSRGGGDRDRGPVRRARRRRERQRS